LISNFKFQISNSKKGITIVEVIVTIFIITMFSGIIISDFPKVRKRFALSTAAHNLAQDLRRAQDMGLSGVQLVDVGGEELPVKGFGLYINLNSIGGNKRYIIYGDSNGNEQYDYDIDYDLYLIDMNNETKGVIIEGLYNVLESRHVSINFSPPNPKTSISGLEEGMSRIKIILALESDTATTREVYVNTSGLIETK